MSNKWFGEDFISQGVRRTAGFLLVLMLLAWMPGYVQAGTAPENSRNALQSLIAYALAHNPEVAATAFDGQAASARTQAAQGALLPRITIEGGDMLQPMAIAAIGGLLMENFVSLFLMPVLYLMANRDQGRP